MVYWVLYLVGHDLTRWKLLTGAMTNFVQWNGLILFEHNFESYFYVVNKKWEMDYNVRELIVK